MFRYLNNEMLYQDFWILQQYAFHDEEQARTLLWRWRRLYLV